MPSFVLARAAQRDIVNILRWSKREFGQDASIRYETLIFQALEDIRLDPFLPGSKDRKNLGAGVRTYHLELSRERSRTELGIVRVPRHFILYRPIDEHTIRVSRILHDSRDSQGQRPQQVRPGRPRNPDA